MWMNNGNGGRSSSSFPNRISKSAPCSPLKAKRPPRSDSFHVVHKVPVGDSPYVRAKHVQLVDKQPEKAIALFWGAINAGDRVDSALKDMAIVMKQQNRPEEAIEAIKSLRNRCSEQAQESLDNVLLDLYKRCGRLDDQINLLKHKLQLIYAGLAFNGKRTKTARSQGKKFQVSVEQEATRLLGNLGWAYMQQSDYIAAEAVYRRALAMEPDNNKMCNLGICLMKQGRVEEARLLLEKVCPASSDGRWGADSHLKSYERAQEMLLEARQMQQQQLQESVMFNSARAPQAILTYDSWDYEDDEEPCDESADENINVNIQGNNTGCYKQELNPELLKKKLEMLSMSSNSGTGQSSGNNILCSSSPSKVIQRPQNFSPKPPRPSAARRSLSLESFDHLGALAPQPQAEGVVAEEHKLSARKQLFRELPSHHFLDMPRVLSGEKRRTQRSYDFTGVTEWFTSKCDLILLLFDPHKLDISDEFKRVISSLHGHDDKIKVVLNKADQVDTQQLMRVYGALMWSLGKVLNTRVYIGSFNDKPLNEKLGLIGKELFEKEQIVILIDLMDIPRKACDRKVNEFVKRARAAKAHAHIISHLEKEMPAMVGKNKAQQRLMDNLEEEFAKVSESKTTASVNPVGEVQVVEAGNLVISIQVLRSATRNFSEQTVLGKGGLGTVYRGQLDDGTNIAVKRMESSSCVVSSKGRAELFRFGLG